MNKFLNKLESKIGKFAIPNLILYLIACYIIGFGLVMFAPNLLAYLTLDPGLIMQGQVWRIFSWLLIPPSLGTSMINLFFNALIIIFYYSLGKNLEYTWGTFKFNLFILGGLFFTILGAFGIYGYYTLTAPGLASTASYMMSSMFSTVYVNESIFLAAAATYPDNEIRLYFVLPIKMKWIGVVYGIILAHNVITSGWAVRVAIIASVLNFLIFFFTTRNYKSINQNIKNKVIKSKKLNYKTSKAATNLHKCAVCGKTSEEGFGYRYCSKCSGMKEYCEDHIFNHTHS